MKIQNVIMDIEEIENQILFYEKVKEALIKAKKLKEEREWTTDHERILLHYIDIQNIERTMKVLRDSPVLVKSVRGERMFDKKDFVELMRSGLWVARKEIAEFASVVHENNSPYTSKGKRHINKINEVSCAFIAMKNGND